MPEVCEVTFTAQYLLTKLKGRYIKKIKIISGRYTHENIKGLELFQNNIPLKIINIDNKGKFMWFELLNEKNNNILYLLNTFGLTGQWGFKKLPSSRIKFTIENKDKTKKYRLYYTDQRNFGTIQFTDDITILNNKLNKLERDLLKTPFSSSDFLKWVKNFKHKKTKIVKILMSQEKGKGLGSGLGNYLVPEILYRAKISPHRTLQSLSDKEIKTLANSIKFILRLCYLNNKIGYMEYFEKQVNKHIEGVKSGKFPDYHNDIDIENEEFKFNVYLQKKDPLGNEVVPEKIIGDRTTYWVPSVQK